MMSTDGGDGSNSCDASFGASLQPSASIQMLCTRVRSAQYRLGHAVIDSARIEPMLPLILAPRPSQPDCVRLRRALLSIRLQVS